MTDVVIDERSLVPPDQAPNNGNRKSTKVTQTREESFMNVHVKNKDKTTQTDMGNDSQNIPYGDEDTSSDRAEPSDTTRDAEEVAGEKAQLQEQGEGGEQENVVEGIETNKTKQDGDENEQNRTIGLDGKKEESSEDSYEELEKNYSSSGLTENDDILDSSGWANVVPVPQKKAVDTAPRAKSVIW